MTCPFCGAENNSCDCSIGGGLGASASGGKPSLVAAKRIGNELVLDPDASPAGAGFKPGVVPLATTSAQTSAPVREDADDLLRFLQDFSSGVASTPREPATPAVDVGAASAPVALPEGSATSAVTWHVREPVAS